MASNTSGAPPGLMWTGSAADREWARYGVAPRLAPVWMLLGVNPRDAGRSTAAGVDPIAILEEFWRAGIPRHEVASWLRAGFGADEARVQRELGRTGEDAATFAALLAMDG